MNVLTDCPMQTRKKEAKTLLLCGCRCCARSLSTGPSSRGCTRRTSSKSRRWRHATSTRNCSMPITEIPRWRFADAVLCCAVLCCAVLCCAVLIMWCAMLCCAVLCFDLTFVFVFFVCFVFVVVVVVVVTVFFLFSGGVVVGVSGWKSICRRVCSAAHDIT